MPSYTKEAMDSIFDTAAEIAKAIATGAAGGAVAGAGVGALAGTVAAGPVGAAVVGVVGGVGGGVGGGVLGAIAEIRELMSDEYWFAFWKKKLEECKKDMCDAAKQLGSYPQETRAMKMRDDFNRAIRSGAEIMSCGRIATIGKASERRLRREFLDATVGLDIQRSGVFIHFIKDNSRLVQNEYTCKLFAMTEEAELIGLATLADKVILKNPRAFFSRLKSYINISKEKTKVEQIVKILHGDLNDCIGIDKRRISDAIKNIVEGKSSTFPITPALIHTSDHSWDILPVLITSHSFFLIVISSAETHDDQNEEDVVTLEDVCHCITSIIDVQSEKGIDKLHNGGLTSVDGSNCPSPRIVVVGTYNFDEQRTQIQSKVENIRRWVNMHCSDSAQHNFKAICVNASHQMVVNASDETVVNVADIKKYMANSITSDLKIQTPLSWELFHRLISYLTKNVPIMLLENVATIASFCDIKHDFPSVLNFYHEHGAFLYYPDVQYLNNIIIIDPKWLQEKLHMVLTPKVDQSSPIWRWYKKGILIDPDCENPENIEGLHIGLMMLLEKYRLAAPVHINQEICDLKGPKYFVPFLIKSKRTIPPCKMTSKLHTAPLHFIFPEVKHLPPGVFTYLNVALTKTKQFKMDFESEMSSDQVTYWFGKYDKVILSASPTSISVVVERLKYCGDDYPASNFGSTCQKIFTLLTTEIQKLIKTSCPAFCCECLPERLPHYVTISTDTENTCDTLQCDKGKLYIFKDCEQLWLKMAAPSHTVGKVFKREIHSLGLQPADLERVTRALEITAIDPGTDNSEPKISWWSGIMRAEARKHLMYHLNRLGLAEAAQVINQGKCCDKLGK